MGFSKSLISKLLFIFLAVFSLNLILSALVWADPTFVSNNFQQKWQRADKAISDNLANPARSWIWGPESFGANKEPYAETSGGQREVQYFDKARMEINNSSRGAVTNGLLVRELVSGRLAIGDNASTQRLAANDIPVAGDPSGNNGPTYASFAKVASLNNDNPAQPRIGTTVNELIERNGQISLASGELSNLTRYTYFDSNLKHNIPDIFWYFLNQKGNIYLNGRYQPDQPVLGENTIAPWIDTLGLPLTEAYWAKVTVAGQAKDVLIQAFERRVLTYTPGNAPPFQVEMGNVGRHYYNWRYDSRYDNAYRPSQTTFWTGVNLAGAEFAPSKLPGTSGLDYAYPTKAEIDYFVGKGMNLIRLPFSWERIQPYATGDFSADQINQIDDLIQYATGKGTQVVLDLHNYARYYGKTLGQPDLPISTLADIWGRLASRYKDNKRVIFGLMNEPLNINTATWVAAANAAIQAIRASGASNLVLVAGSSPTNFYNQNQAWGGTEYGSAMLGIYDSASNFVYELHTYLDWDISGTSDACVSQTIGAERLRDFTSWLRQNNQRGFLGEFGSGRNDTCFAALDNMLSYVDNNLDVWLGWAYWAAGPLWGNYILSLEPVNGKDRPQMASLSKHFAGVTRPVAYGPTSPAPASPPPTPTTPPPAYAPPSVPASYKVQYEVQSSWETGYNISVTINNTGGTTVQGWTISWQLDYGESLNSNWNANCSTSGKTITCSSMSYNSEISAGSSQNFGGQFRTTGGKFSQPSRFTVNGVTVNP